LRSLGRFIRVRHLVESCSLHSLGTAGAGEDVIIWRPGGETCGPAGPEREWPPTWACRIRPDACGRIGADT
jgi:hypothetical protein